MMAKRTEQSLSSSLESCTDEELLARMRAGEEEAFDLLFTRREGLVYRFALRMSGSTAMADDVTQDVFLALIRSAHLFDPSRGPLSKYLLGMTRNRVLTLLERQRSLVPLQEDDGEEVSLPEARRTADSDPLGELVRSERIEAVRSAILSLPLHYREAVLLCSLEELSYEEAADLIGCPVGTIRSRINRAKAMLAERLHVSQAGADSPKMTTPSPEWRLPSESTV